MEAYTILLFCSSLFSILIISTATDTLTMSQSMRDGESIVSAGGIFELGFFSPGNSTKRYLGIWCSKMSTKTAVWVANREIPLADSSGVLEFTSQGILVLLNQNKTIIWSSNSSRLVPNPIAQILDSGNFVMRDGNHDDPEDFLWQSFDYPGDTYLPGMKIGRNLITGHQWYVSSWKSNDDPSHGNFTGQVDPPVVLPQIVIWKGSVEQFRGGAWNGIEFTGIPALRLSPLYKINAVSNKKEMYYSYWLVNSSSVTRLVLSPNGIAQLYIATDLAMGWELYLSAQTDKCDSYALCGAYGSCNVENSPECGCLNGFVPKSPKDWGRADYSNGCVRRTALDCKSGDTFVKYSGVKVPDSRNSWFNESMSLKECKMVCLMNCSCTAYANMYISEGGSGCLLWFGDLFDIRVFSQNGVDLYGQDMYVRVASSEVGQVGSTGMKRPGKKRKRIIISLVSLAGMLLLGLGLTLYVWKKFSQGKRGHGLGKGYTTEDLELPLFDLTTITNATNNFSINNQLGKGGFGPVYKGVLEDGKEIAVKRLSKNSKQGLPEFRNEVIHIAKLQHRNLVKLLGFCIDVDEMMLIYEFMPNKSLDFFIFDQTQSMLLDWPKRFNIINGIAQGLLYLHRDSRLRIIHRDLKAGNILLDNEMNPKISDFGLARSFCGNETEANTNKVVGTYGYMSPEYAIDGIYSIKSDVFSFGVLLLEIVSGKKNKGFHHPDHHVNLIGHAWKLHIEGRSLELIDASIRDDPHILSEVLRSIHVGLLCVQRCPEDRPNMSSVVLMLGREGALPQPKKPGFYIERTPVEGNSSSSVCELCSANEITITQLEAR